MNELEKRAKHNSKHSKGMGWYKGGQLNPNAGNVEHNVGFFNNAMGASDAGSGQAMGESVDTVKYRIIPFDLDGNKIEDDPMSETLYDDKKYAGEVMQQLFNRGEYSKLILREVGDNLSVVDVIKESLESVSFSTIDDVLGGYTDNMSDEQIDSEIKFFKSVARLLGVKDYTDVVVVIDGDYEYYPGYYDIQPTHTIKGRDAQEYHYNDSTFVAEKLNGNAYYFFKSEEDAKNYITSLDSLNESFTDSQSNRKALKENKADSVIFNATPYKGYYIKKGEWTVGDKNWGTYEILSVEEGKDRTLVWCYSQKDVMTPESLTVRYAQWSSISEAQKAIDTNDIEKSGVFICKDDDIKYLSSAPKRHYWTCDRCGGEYYVGGKIDKHSTVKYGDVCDDCYATLIRRGKDVTEHINTQFKGQSKIEEQTASNKGLASIRKKCLEHSKVYTDNVLVVENYAGCDEVACEYDIPLNTLVIYSTENRYNTVFSGKLIESAPSIFEK